MNSVESAAVGTDPENAGRVLNHRAGSVGAEPLARTHGAKALIAQNVQPAGFGSHPEIAFAVFDKAED